MPAASANDRDRFVLARREHRPYRDPWRHQGVIVEDERTAEGRIERSATVFLTGRECPWRCVMCDLWRQTIEPDTPRGAIPTQIAAALAELRARAESITQIKMYNAGSFFDPGAVPEDDYGAVAELLATVGRVVVESHPALVGRRLDRFLEALHRSGETRPASGRLEVAMGLETVHAEALDRLNKRMTVDGFVATAAALRRRGVSVRAFLLLSPPFVPHAEQDDWLLRSIDVAFSCGAAVVSLIPTRSGNGAMEVLSSEGVFQPPRLEDVERSMASALLAEPGRGRIFVDLWDLQRLSDCTHCFDARRARLHAMNLEQRLSPRAACPRCGSGATC